MLHIIINMKTTILVEEETRDRLKKLGRKNQTYDQLINELIILKKFDSLDSGLNAQASSEPQQGDQ